MDSLRRFVATQEVEIKLKEEAFTEEFMAEFRRGFYGFTTIDEHAQHIAQLYARGLHTDFALGFDFIEGYGNIRDFVSEVTLAGFEIEPVSVALQSDGEG